MTTHRLSDPRAGLEPASRGHSSPGERRPPLARWAQCALSILVVAGCSRSPEDGESASRGLLTVHVGGTMRPAIAEIASRYEKKTGAKVEINSADSGELLAFIESHKEGDLYVCHDPFVDLLMDRGLGEDAWTIAALTPVIVVRKGNPKGIKGISDLTRQDLTVALTDYDHSTLGHLLPVIFKKAGMDFEQVKARPNIQNFRQGSQAANVVVTGNADAAMVWNAVAFLRSDTLEAIPVEEKFLPMPGVDAVTSATKRLYDIGRIRVTVATLKCSQDPVAAARFAAFAASEEGTAVFKDLGFTAVTPGKEYENGKKLAP